MTTKAHNFENGTNGTTVSAANSAGTAGVQDAFSGSSLFPGCTYASTAAVHGSLGLNVTAASGVSAFVDHSGFASTQVVDRFYYTPASIAATTEIYQTRTSAGQSYGINHNSAGTLSALDASGTSRITSSTLTTGTTYRVELQGVSDASAGTLALQIYIGDATGTPFYSGTASSLNTRGGNITNSRIGKVGASTVTGNFVFDDFKTVDGTTTAIGPVATPPVAVISNTGFVGLQASFSGTSSTFTSPATSISSYAWTFGDGGTSTSSAPTYTYATAGAYTVGLTVTDNNGVNATTETYNAYAPGTNVGLMSVPLATGWTPTPSGTALSVLNDNDPTTYLLSGVNPTSLELDVQPLPLIFPASGFPFVCAILCDYTGSGSSGNVVAKLYDNGVLKSTAATVPVLAGSGGTVTSWSICEFPYSDVGAITANDWKNGNFTTKLFFTAS